MTNSEEQVCRKCGHRATINGVCQVGTGEPHPVTGYKAICGCKCSFVERALPEDKNTEKNSVEMNDER